MPKTPDPKAKQKKVLYNTTNSTAASSFAAEASSLEAIAASISDDAAFASYTPLVASALDKEAEDVSTLAASEVALFTGKIASDVFVVYTGGIRVCQSQEEENFIPS